MHGEVEGEGKGKVVQVAVPEDSLPENQWFLNLEKEDNSGVGQPPLPTFETIRFGDDAVFLASLGGSL